MALEHDNHQVFPLVRGWISFGIHSEITARQKPNSRCQFGCSFPILGTTGISVWNQAVPWQLASALENKLKHVNFVRVLTARVSLLSTLYLQNSSW